MQVSFRTAIAMAAMLAVGARSSFAKVLGQPARKTTAQPPKAQTFSRSKPHRTDVNGCGQREQLRAYRRAQGGPGIELWNGNWISR